MGVRGQIAAELRQQLRRGFAPSALIGAEKVLALGQALGFGALAPGELANLIHNALVAAVNALPADESEAARELFGLTPGAEKKTLSLRREIAAAKLNVGSESFRKHRQQRLLDDVAAQLLLQAAERMPSPHGTGRLPPSRGSHLRDERSVLVLGSRSEQVHDYVLRLLTMLGLRPFSFQDAVRAVEAGAPTVLDALDAALDFVQAVVVVLDADEPDGRPRRNALFEAGLALGRARRRTIVVAAGGLQLPNDMAGMNVLRLNDSLISRNALRTRLESLGCALDPHADEWLPADLRGLASVSLPPATAQQVTTRLAQAVADLHERGLVHKDIRPENILVGDRADVRLIDFASARPLETEPLPPSPGADRVYALGGAADPADDVFATAVVIANVLIGKPGVAPTPDARAELDQAEVPDEVAEVLTRALAENPRERPSARELANVLARAHSRARDS